MMMVWWIVRSLVGGFCFADVRRYEDDDDDDNNHNPYNDDNKNQVDIVVDDFAQCVLAHRSSLVVRSLSLAFRAA